MPPKHPREYNAWYAMLDRCLNKSHRYYHRYGGRGITVDKSWLEFKNFFADMGPQPKGFTLERKKNDLGYSKENCVWATKKAQANNRSSNRLITIEGVTKNVQQWIEHFPHLKGRRYVVHQRLADGWSEEEAILTPVRAKRH